MKRMQTVVTLFFLGLQLFALAWPREAAAAKATLTIGVVNTATRKPFRGVTVTIKKAGSRKVLAKKVTGRTGIATFGLNTGIRYVVECIKSGQAFTPPSKTLKLTRSKRLNYAARAMDPAAVETIRVGIVAALARHPELDTQVPQSPAFYQAVADELAQIPGVEGADYPGDALGTISVKVRGGGVLTHRHITSVLTDTLPPGVSLSGKKHPVYTADWQPPVNVEGRFAPISNTYANHFPWIDDPEYLSDSPLNCRPEGKVAIIDFYSTEVHAKYNLYETDFMVDGVMIWDRVERVLTAAGFTVHRFTDAQINLGNYTMLQDYALVITNGHGGRPGPLTTKRLGIAVTSMFTPEIYNPGAITAKGITYFEAWVLGYINYNAETLAISWTSLLFRESYRPTVPQQWLTSQCYTMLPSWEGLDGLGDVDVYNIGEGLIDAGVRSVFGYLGPAWPRAIVPNLMTYLRRTVGGFSEGDKPPASFGRHYWPLCMSAQTFFRLPATPDLPIYADKSRFGSIFTGYTPGPPLYIRAACQENRYNHDYFQSFLLWVGTSARALPNCWDNYYSIGNYPSCNLDPLCCNWGENPTTVLAVEDAACNVSIARKATNAFLTTP